MRTQVDIEAWKKEGATRVQLACGLKAFPRELFDLSDTLEILDLSGNHLSQLPDDFGRLQKLRILFLSNNDFEVLPKVLADCPALSMVGFKANRIRQVPEHGLPKDLRWLILTDNQIERLPDSMGEHHRLQKLMLAGNQLTALPDTMQQCRNLELIRIAANRFTALPDWLFELPKLAWLAFSGNPCSRASDVVQPLPVAHWDDLRLNEVLGEGASGVISKAAWEGRGDVAVKLFKGEVTSDGLPEDEVAALVAVGEHAHLMGVVAQLTGHPEKQGLVFDLLEEDFKNLGMPPCLDSCTRDRYAEERRFSLAEILTITRAIASAAMHLHQQQIKHGDLYAHNILINATGACLLSDFGAATRYASLHPEAAIALEWIEVRAFGCLMEDLLTRISEGVDANTMRSLEALQHDCLQGFPRKRPLFAAIVERLHDENLHVSLA